MLSHKFVDSPVGRLKLVATDQALVAIVWENDGPGRVRLGASCAKPDDPLLLEAERQLNEYFSGKRRSFSLPLQMLGTSFQKSVWNALLTIPFGQTRSYGQLATQLRKPAASRAVGAANGRNPLAIVVPCHRVIGSSGNLTGFAGGLDAKRLLLNLENVS